MSEKTIRFCYIAAQHFICREPDIALLRNRIACSRCIIDKFLGVDGLGDTTALSAFERASHPALVGRSHSVAMAAWGDHRELGPDFSDIALISSIEAVPTILTSYAGDRHGLRRRRARHRGALDRVRGARPHRFRPEARRRTEGRNDHLRRNPPERRRRGHRPRRRGCGLSAGIPPPRCTASRATSRCRSARTASFFGTLCAIDPQAARG